MLAASNKALAAKHEREPSHGAAQTLKARGWARGGHPAGAFGREEWSLPAVPVYLRRRDQVATQVIQVLRPALWQFFVLAPGGAEPWNAHAAIHSVRR